MNRATLGSAAFLLFALAIAAWVLTRSGSHAASDVGDAAEVAATGAGMTFAEWSVRNDAVLLAEIEPGAGTSTVPKRFTVFAVQQAAGAPATLKERGAFSWSAADRAVSASALHDLGFSVSTEGTAFNPPSDPLWSDPIARADGGTEQVVMLRTRDKPELTATFTRHLRDVKSAAYWNRRAIGFPSSDGRLVYVTPGRRDDCRERTLTGAVGAFLTLMMSASSTSFQVVSDDGHLALEETGSTAVSESNDVLLAVMTKDEMQHGGASSPKYRASPRCSAAR